MFDFVRNLMKSAAEKRLERLNAYADGELSSQQMQVFEQELAQDTDLQRELAVRQTMKAQLSQLPRRAVPRHFTLDPAKYGRPAPQPLFQLYPVMRMATVMTAFFFVLAIGLSMMSGAQIGGTFAPVAYELESVREVPAGEISMADEQVVEVTRVVTETIIEVVTEEGEALVAAPSLEDAADEPAMEAPAEEAIAQETEVDDDTAVTADTGSVAPLATASPTPRPDPTTEIARRATAVATIALPAIAEQAEPTSTIPDDEPEPVIASRAVDWWEMAVIASFVLFIILLSLTLYVRRQLM